MLLLKTKNSYLKIENLGIFPELLVVNKIYFNILIANLIATLIANGIDLEIKFMV